MIHLWEEESKKTVSYGFFMELRLFKFITFSFEDINHHFELIIHLFFDMSLFSRANERIR